MKKILCLIVFTFILGCVKGNSQENILYDYIEVIVIQKMNNSGKIKRIKVEEQESLQGKLIAVKEIESLKSTSALLNYMNNHQWEYVDRRAVTEVGEPVWMSYLFRKRK